MLGRAHLFLITLRLPSFWAKFIDPLLKRHVALISTGSVCLLKLNLRAARLIGGNSAEISWKILSVP